MLVIENCRLTWPDFTADYSLTVETGHLCAVIGPSGGGKTTLLHMIAGFERPESGTLSFNGQKPPAARAGQAPGRHRVPGSQPVSSPERSAERGARAAPIPAADGRRDTRVVAEMLDSVGLKGFDDRRPGEMSGGQRQRVALARALISGRPLILLDEPFSSLDPALRRDMILLVDEMRRKRAVTILMTIHTPEDVADVADQMAFVADGRVVASGHPGTILNSALAPRIAAAVSDS